MAGFSLPLQGSKARQALGDMAAVVELLDPRNLGRMPSFPLARRQAREYLAAEPAAQAVTYVCLRANDERWLVSFDRDGGWKKLWSFGTGRD